MEYTAKTEESMADLQLEVCGGYLRFVSKEAVFYQLINLLSVTKSLTITYFLTAYTNQH